jgi:hypothetical protein
MSPSSRRAQIFSLDLMFAMLVVSSIFGAYFLMSSTVTSTLTTDRLRQSITEDAQGALLLLISSSGEPTNWTLYNFSTASSSAVRSIGLASSPFVLDRGRIAKLAAVNSTNYTALKSYLGIDKPDYTFQFSLKLSNGTTENIAGFPRRYQNLTSTVATGIVLVDGEPALASVLLWVGEYE